jgi:tripartite-type tricarboxylate transporter receptor subunit TctC
MRLRHRLAMVVTALLLSLSSAHAQTDYPTKTIRILIGFPPGTAPDIASRAIGDRLSKTWGVPVIVENVTGASGNLATERAAKATSDGYTLLMAGSAAIVINPTLNQNLPFEPVRDLAPVSQICMTPNILLVPHNVPAKSVQELVALARAEPGKLTFGSAGLGTSQHLAGELFKTMAGIDILHVPYRGGTAFIPDLLGGRLSMAFTNISNALPMMRGGKVTALAITSLKRSPSAPDIPTMAELGFPNFDATVWFGVMAPTQTPAPIVAKIRDELIKAMNTPEVQKTFLDLGMLPIGNTPDEFAEAIKTETARWAKIIKASGAEAVAR